ncbi:MAG: hypothetical protein ACP5JR_07980, partial [Thermoplasmata archaeon]
QKPLIIFLSYFLWFNLKINFYFKKGINSLIDDFSWRGDMIETNKYGNIITSDYQHANRKRCGL